MIQTVKNLPEMGETWVQSQGWEDPLEEGRATHSSVLAWRIPIDKRILVGYSPRGHKELDTTERLSTDSEKERDLGWGGRWEGGSGWGICVNPWLIHVNVWQKPLQYCKVISLQLIKINGKRKRAGLEWTSVGALCEVFSYAEQFKSPFKTWHF